MNGRNNSDKPYRVYSLAHAADLFTFWSSKLKGQGNSRPKFVVAKACPRVGRSPSSSCPVVISSPVVV